MLGKRGVWDDRNFSALLSVKFALNLNEYVLLYLSGKSLFRGIQRKSEECSGGLDFTPDTKKSGQCQHCTYMCLHSLF